MQVLQLPLVAGIHRPPLPPAKENWAKKMLLTMNGLYLRLSIKTIKSGGEKFFLKWVWIFVGYTYAQTHTQQMSLKSKYEGRVGHERHLGTIWTDHNGHIHKSHMQTQLILKLRLICIHFAFVDEPGMNSHGFLSAAEMGI